MRGPSNEAPNGGEQHQGDAGQLRQLIDPDEPHLVQRRCLVQQLVKDMAAGTVGALLIAGVNPAHSLPNAASSPPPSRRWASASVSAATPMETASLCSCILPDNHWFGKLERHDAESGPLRAGACVDPLFRTRQWPESLLRWSGDNTAWHDYIRNVWQANMARITARARDLR